MSHPVDALVARFGEAGLRRFGTDAEAADPDAPEAAALARIAGLALPLQVGPYFRTDGSEPASVRGYAVQTDRSLSDEVQLSWSRLGSDGGYEITATPEGGVQALLLDYDEPLRFVNSSPEELASALLGLDGLLGLLGRTDSPEAAEAAVLAFERQLQEADPRAFADRESWWPLVLDDIRDTSTVVDYAAFEVVDADGEKKIFTGSGGIALHPEEKLWAALEGAGVRPEQVTGVHTDLEACYLPGHYCSMWLAATFPDATVTHSFDYGETAASRSSGIAALRAATASAPEAGRPS